jgi:hypothetical protein
MFERLKHLIQTKQELKEDLAMDTSFTPFMSQRWLSMYNREYCIRINDTTNRLYQGITDKNDWYRMLQMLVPCNSYRFIKYIKKKKNSKQLNHKYICFVAENLEISKREAEDFLNNNPFVIKQLKKSLGE